MPTPVQAPAGWRRLARVLAVVTAVSGFLTAVDSAAIGATPTPSTEVTVTQDVQYGPGQQLVLDVYRRPDAEGAAVVMLIHGGGWSKGDKDKFEEESTSLARAGFVVFDINYTLVNEEGPAYPSQVEDVHTALSWIRQNAVNYGGDPGRLGVLGGSAGGYLAAILALQANTEAEQPVRALVVLSGPMDLPTIGREVRGATTNPDGTCAPVTCQRLEYVNRSIHTLLGCNPGECPDELLAEASPSTYASEYSPPSYFANSTEEVVDPAQSESVAELLRADNVPVETEVIDGDFHSVGLLPMIAGDVLDFLTTHLTAVEPTPTPTASSSVPEQPIDAVGTDESRLPSARWLVAGGVLILLAIAFVIRRLQTSGRPE